MSPKVQTIKYVLASTDLLDAYTDFILSRQAMLVSPGTLRWYGFTAGRFCKWLETQGVTRPDEVTARHVRAYLAELAPNLADTTLHGQARAVKTLLLFWNAENYLPQVVKFEMPKLADKKLLVLDAEELKKVISSCKKVRDKALVMFLADTGVRRAELLALTWDDIDMQTGAVKVLRGKGGKFRTVFCGAKTRRALLKYRRELADREGRIFPLTESGLGSLLNRVSGKAGMKITAHSLRRTFATLAVRSGMSLVHLSALLGHSSLEMTRHYVRLLVDDLQEAHRRVGQSHLNSIL
jgi:integrase/recombinase XerD